METNISNAAIYDLLKEFKGDFLRRFDEQERRMEEYRRDLNAKIDDLKTDLNAKIDDVKTDLNAKIDNVRTDLGDLKTDLNAKIDNVRTDVDDLKTDMSSRIIDLKEIIKDDKSKLQEVYDSRDKVKLQVTRAWGVYGLGMGMLGGMIITILFKVFDL